MFGLFRTGRGRFPEGMFGKGGHKAVLRAVSFAPLLDPQGKILDRNPDAGHFKPSAGIGPFDDVPIVADLIDPSGHGKFIGMEADAPRNPVRTPMLREQEQRQSDQGSNKRRTTTEGGTALGKAETET